MSEDTKREDFETLVAKIAPYIRKIASYVWHEVPLGATIELAFHLRSELSSADFFVNVPVKENDNTQF